MFEIILIIIATIGMVGYIIVDLFVPEKQKCKSYRECHPNCSDKWVFIPSHGLYLVKGDFWVGYNPKAEMQYQIVNVDCVLYEFKTKEEMSEALEQLAEFMDDNSVKVFYLETYEDWKRWFEFQERKSKLENMYH